MLVASPPPAPEPNVPRLLQALKALLDRRVVLMEVCGTHTVSLFRSGLRSLLPEEITLLSGPGCPVCVTAQGEIDAAIGLAESGCLVLTYGDMARVPGSHGSLAGLGKGVQVVTSAAQSLAIARRNPGRDVVFLGVGFETTAPATASTIMRAYAEGEGNLSVLCLHKTVPPVLRHLCMNPELKLDGFMLPGNVAVVTGEGCYGFLASEFSKAAAVAGFEPEEMLSAIIDLVRQVHDGPRLSSYRRRDVPREGNASALRAMSEVFEPCDAEWRGLGVIPMSGLAIREKYSGLDAAKRFGLAVKGEPEDCGCGCGCGKVLSGLMTPPECGMYGTVCTPETPVGPCMVSSEGTCGTWYRWSSLGTAAAGASPGR
ncbi:MAG: hydrogenase formation protein HypD [Synergistaceae bacterium]|nr:hydrogenase formation protein HypD [Synergistaceae bacterium]